MASLRTMYRGAWVVAAIVALSAPSYATTTTLSTNGDTYLRGSNQNDGTKTFLRLRSSGDNRALVQFDQAQILAAMNAGVLISAQLELFIELNNDSWGSSGREIDVHRVTTNWTELGATHNCPIDTDTSNGSPDCPVQWNNGDFAPTATASFLQTNGVTGAVQFDVTADVQAFISGTNNFGWIVKKLSESAGGVVEYTSRDGTANQEPKLILDIAPPTSTPTSTPSDTPTATPTNTPTNTFTATATFTPDTNCAPQPILGCRQSIQENKSLLLLKDKSGTKDKLIFKWIKGEATDISVLGDPVVDTTYSLCLYDETAGVPSLVLETIVPPAGSCNGKPCWKSNKSGFRFKDTALVNGGIKTITLKSGTTGKSKIVVKGLGGNLNLPPLPLQQDQRVIAQLKNDFMGGQCFEARFSGPAKKNQSDFYKDKGDAPVTFLPTATQTFTFTPTATPVGSAATATATATDTPTSPPGAPTDTPTDTPTPTPTSTPLPGLGTNTCVLDFGQSQLLLTLETSVLGVNPSGSVSIDCSAVDPVTGISLCTCDVISIDAIPLLGVGDVCVASGGACPVAEYDCDGGSPLDLDHYSDHDVGNCTSNAGCAASCDAFCTALGSTHTRQASSCEGFCLGGPNDEMACVEDADCPSGNCPGLEPVQGGIHAGDCNCSCQATNVGSPSSAGTFTCGLGLAITVERDNDQICGNVPPAISLPPLCGALTSARADGVLEHVNSKPKKSDDIGPLNTTGAGLACNTFGGGSVTGLKLVGYLAFFDSSLTDIFVQETFVCQ